MTTATPIADVMSEVADLTTLLIDRHAKQLATLTDSAPATDLETLTQQVQIAEDHTCRAEFSAARIHLTHLPEIATHYRPAALRDVDRQLTAAIAISPAST
ncbi:MAG: hypothetical protein ACTHZ5_15995 [Micrococcaceae bacterium]